MKESLTLEVLHALDLAVFERMPDLVFIAVTPPPAWVKYALAAASEGQPLTLGLAFPFLDRFLTEAETFWRQGTERSILSGPFVVPWLSGEALARAWALNLGPRNILVLERLKGEADPRALLQTARENKLEQERLQRQVESLQTPLATLVRLVKELLATEPTAAQRELADRVSRALAKIESVSERTSGGS
jgi:hypothetical protein